MSETDHVYRKLQIELDRMPIGFPATESGVEIKLLKCLYTQEEAELTCHLSMWIESFKHLYKRMKKKGMSKTKLNTLLNSLDEKGAIFSSKNGEKRYYSKPQFIVGVFELQIGRLTKEFYEYFTQYEEELLHKEMTKIKNQVRTIPVEKSVTPELNISSYDDIRYYVERYDGNNAVADCVCRIGTNLIGEKCKQTDLLNVCISFNEVARTFVKRGTSRVVTKEECFEILRRAEKAGLVLQPSNSRVPMFICCCCGCCCAALKTVKRLPHPAHFYNNNFFARVNQESCIGCGKCLKRCQMDAITVENKISNVNLSRCIGCGLCVTTCEKKAIQLYPTKKKISPPRNSALLYIQVLYKKYGFWKLLKMGLPYLYRKTI